MIDTLPADITDDLVAVPREALSNIARHAAAHSAEVDLTANPDRVVLTVADDGLGLGPTAGAGTGERAGPGRARGGTFALAARRPSGTELC